MTLHHRTRGALTDVYRLYDATGRLLYVGIGVNGYARLDAHRREKAWWPQVTRVRMEQYRSRRTAFLVEARAIATEHPIHNQAFSAVLAVLAACVGELPAPVDVDDWEMAA